jgi:hypothetical protein
VELKQPSKRSRAADGNSASQDMPPAAAAATDAPVLDAGRPAADDFSFKDEAAAPVAMLEAAPAPACSPAKPAVKAGKKGAAKAPAKASLPPAAPAAAAGAMEVEERAGGALSAPTDLAAAYSLFCDAVKSSGKNSEAAAVAAWVPGLRAYVATSLAVDVPHPLAQALQRFQTCLVALLLADGVDAGMTGCGRHIVQPTIKDGLSLPSKEVTRMDAPTLHAALVMSNTANGARSKSMKCLKTVGVMLGAGGREAAVDYVRKMAVELERDGKAVPASITAVLSVRAGAGAGAAADATAAGGVTPPNRPTARIPAGAKTPAVVRTTHKIAPASAKPKAAAVEATNLFAGAAGAGAGAPPPVAQDEEEDDGSLPDLDFEEEESGGRSSGSGSGASAVPLAVVAAALQSDAPAPVSAASRGRGAVAAPPALVAEDDSMGVAPSAPSVPAFVPSTPAAAVGAAAAMLAVAGAAVFGSARQPEFAATPASAAVLAALGAAGRVVLPPAAPSSVIQSLAAAGRNKKIAEEAEAKRAEQRAQLRALVDQRKAAAGMSGQAAAAALPPAAAATPIAAAAPPAAPINLGAQAEARMRAAEEERKAAVASIAQSRAAEIAASTAGVREKAAAAVAGVLLAPPPHGSSLAAPAAALAAPAPVAAPAAAASAGLPPRAVGGLLSAGIGPGRIPHSGSKPPSAGMGLLTAAAATSVKPAAAMPPAAPSAATLSAAAAASRVLSPTRSTNQLLAAVGSPAAKAVLVQQVVALAVAGASAPAPRPAAPSAEADNYEMSDKGSDSEDEDEEKPRKPIPDWARGPALDEALQAQYGGNASQSVNPDMVFHEVETCDLDAIFPVKKKRFHKRTSSGLWAQDRLTVGEKDRYRVDMGYAAPGARPGAGVGSGRG